MNRLKATKLFQRQLSYRSFRAKAAARCSVPTLITDEKFLGLARLASTYFPPTYSFKSLCTVRRNSSMTTAEDPKLTAKKISGYKAVEENLLPNFKVVGIGSGSTVVFCVERIGQLTREGVLPSHIKYVPTGFQSRLLLIENGLEVSDIDQFAVGDLDIVFDGADEIDSNLQCIKGGGACLLQEKLVGLCSKKFVIVADDSKQSERLGTKWRQGVPIEIVPLARTKVASELRALGAKHITLREGGKAKAGPIVTDNGNFILDADFGSLDPAEVSKLDKQIKLITGVVETGLFTYGSKAYIGTSDGRCETLTSK